MAKVQSRTAAAKSYQIGVPMIWHIPGMQAHKYAHRTTHYDMVPTLMKEYLGVKNYRLPAKQFDKAIKQLNRFFK